ncbi:hypothetical protein ACPWSR_03765 [Alloiococcus sp. CFN-8]|uniref:hypothetical protein n=1 Tax=Alloiococcus sp. CFN-8 TaxID=3416081 RepID=UPI003CF35EB5
MIPIDKDKRKEVNKGSYYLRAFAGAYLLYLVYGLLEDYKNKPLTNELLIIVAICVFFAAGIMLLYTSLRYLYIHRGSLSSESNEEG